MALARVLEIIAFLIYIQESWGQFNSLINNNPTLGQNSLNQAFQSNANIKGITNNLLQKENLGKNTNLNSQKQVNLQQSPSPQSSLSTTQQFLLQQSQSFPQLTKQQSSHISDIQQPLLYQPQPSFVQQSLVQQQPYNYLESSTFVPANNVGNINVPPQTPSIQPVPVQVSQSIPLSNTYVPSYSSVTAVPTCGGQRTEFATSLGGSYLIPVSTLPISSPEGQIVTSYPTLRTMVLSGSSPAMLGNNVVLPYSNQIFGVLDDPLDNSIEAVLGEEVASLTSDKIATLLMSLLQHPKKSSKYNQPYSPYTISEDTKSPSLKTLLPIILNLIKEKREGCVCHSGCKCNRNNRNKKDSAPQSIEDYITKRDNNLREEMFHNDEIKEDIPRKTREHNKHKISKNPVPDISNENDDMDYDSSSEEED